VTTHDRTANYYSYTIVAENKDGGKDRKGDRFMKKRLLVSGLLVSLLALGLVFTSCDNGSTDEYTLAWGSFNSSLSMVQNTITQQGWNVVDTNDPGGSGYAIGADAQAIYIYCLNNIGFDDGGGADGSFGELLNYTVYGIGLPQNLKAGLATQEAYVPVAGIFYNGINTTVFYITRK
jgi:hypothetical protein